MRALAARSGGAAGVSHDSPRAQMCTFQGPGLSKTPTKFHERTPRERKKNENCGGRREKKSEILGGPAEGGPGEKPKNLEHTHHTHKQQPPTGTTNRHHQQAPTGTNRHQQAPTGTNNQEQQQPGSTTTTENLAKTLKQPNWPNAVWPNAVNTLKH